MQPGGGFGPKQQVRESEGEEVSGIQRRAGSGDKRLLQQVFWWRAGDEAGRLDLEK